MARMNLRYRLLDLHLSYAWLIDRMKHRGMVVDKSTLSSSVNGTIRGERVDRIIELGNEILDEYEKKYLGSGVK